MPRKKDLEAAAWAKKAEDALKTLESGDMKAVTHFLDTMTAEKAGGPATWRKTRILLENAQDAVRRGSVPKVREFIKAIHAVTLLAGRD